jgi:hypothetical protein
LWCAAVDGEVSHAHDTGVHAIREDADDPSRLAVWFWGYSPVCYLTGDHPEFDRIRIEGETEIWWKILDVRVIESLPTGA